MMSRLVDNLILYILLLKQQLYKTSLCWMLILPLQTFLVMLIAIQANLNNSSSNLISSSLLKIWQQMNSETVTRFLIIFCSCLIIIWVLLATLFILFKKPRDKLDIYHQFANRLITVCSLLLIVLEFALFNLIILVRNIFHFPINQDPIQLDNNLAFFLPACFIAIIVVSIINYRIRLMGAFYLLFFILQGISNNFDLVNLVLGFTICLYAIYADEQTQFLLIKQRNLRKVLHLLLAFFFLWNFVISIDNQNTDQLQSYLPYVYLLVFFISSLTIGIVKFTCKVNKKQPPVIQLCQCLNKIKNNEQDNFSKLMALEIQNEYMRTNSKLKQINSMKWKMEEKSESVSYWEDERWKTLINSMIEKQMQKEFSLKSSINMIKCRLMTKDQRIFQVMEALKELISKQKQLGLYQKYQILKISLKIKKACFAKTQSEEFPAVQILRQVDMLNEKFYLNASKLIRNVYMFWSIVLSKKIQDSDIINPNDLKVTDGQNMCTQTLIEDIQKQIKSLKETVVEIQKLSVAQQQKKILEQVMRICTGLSQGEKSYIKMQNEIEEGIERTNKDYFECIEIIDNKISYMSLKLANELGYKKTQITNQNLSQLIPKQYEQTIQNKIRTIQKQSYTFEYYIPLKCSNSTVILKQLKLYLQIDYKYGYRVILHSLNNSYKNQQPFIMYNILSNTVQYFNQAFVVGYEFESVTSRNKQKEKKCEYKVLNHNQLFYDLDLSDKDIQAKLSESGADVQYNCKMFIPKPKEKKFVNFQNVRVSLIQKNLNYLILRVVKGHRLKSVAGGFSNVNHPSHQSSNISFSLSNPSSLSYSMGKMKQRIDDENATYCKIENPYELKINRKKKQLLDNSKLSLRFIAILIIFFVTLFFLLQSISFLIISFKVNDEMQSEHENTLNQFEQYTLLMQAYQSYFEQTIVNLQKQRLQQMNIDVDRILKQNRDKIETNINSFQKIYLQNLLIPQHAPIPYKIKFKNFDIETDTSKTNLFDYSQNLLQYDNNDSLQFLINNYRTFGQLIIRTCDVQGHSQQNVAMYQNVFYIVSGAAFFVILVGVGVGVGIGREIGGVCADVQFVFQLIEPQYLQKMFKQLKYINENLLKNKDQQSKSHHIQYNKAARGMPIRQKSISMIDSIIQPQENDEQKQIMIQQNFVESLTQKQSDEKYLKNKDKREKQQSYWHLLFFIVLTSVIVMVQAFYLCSSIQKSSMALDYALQGRKMAQNIIHQVLQTQYQITLREFLKDTTQTYDLNLFSVKLTINDKKLPVEEFKQFTQSIFDKNSGNLCQTLTNQTRITYSKSVCNKIGGGIFAYGISKTIEYLNQILVYSIKKSEWIAPSRFSTLLRSQQIVFSQQMILAINKENEEEFERYYEKFNRKVRQSAIQLFLLGCGLSFLLVIVNLYTRRHIYSMGKIAVGYFLIIPQKVLLQSEILDYIRKNDILNRISSI